MLDAEFENYKQEYIAQKLLNEAYSAHNALDDCRTLMSLVKKTEKVDVLISDYFYSTHQVSVHGVQPNVESLEHLLKNKVLPRTIFKKLEDSTLSYNHLKIAYHRDGFDGLFYLLSEKTGSGKARISNNRVSQSRQVSYIIIYLIAVNMATIVIAAFKSYVFVPPKILSQETIKYDQGGKTTVLKCNVLSYLPLTSAAWCRLLPQNECVDIQSSIVWKGKGLRTIIFETSEELESATYKCMAGNIIGVVESPPVQLNENENDEPLPASTPSSSTNDDMQTNIHELFQKEECGKHYFARVIFIGKNGVGKTSLMRRLLWGTKEQSSSTQSTDGIDIKKCNLNVRDGNWSPCNKIDHDLARLIQQVYTERKVNVNEASGQIFEHSSFVQGNLSLSSYNSEVECNQALVLHEKISHDHQMEVNNQSSQDKPNQIEVYESRFNFGTNNMTEDSSDTDDSSVDETKGESGNNINYENGKNFKTTERDSSQEKANKIQFENFEDNQINYSEVDNRTGLENDENIVQMTSSVINSCLHRNGDESHDMLAFCALWDFAGQKDFYATHQVFLSKCAVFLLVTDSLESSHADKLWIDFKDSAQYVRFWFDTIHCYWSTTKDCRLDPPIIVVCTNEDKIKDRKKRQMRQNKFKKNLGKILKEQKKKDHLRNIYFVSNTDDDDNVFQEIRQDISSQAMKMTEWGRDCPLKWLLFQEIVGKLKDSNVPISTTTKLLTIAKHDSIGIHSDKEFKLCLQYFHDIGTVIYFDEENLKDHVILDPKWLIDAFRCLVSDKIENIIEISDDWQKLRETGELTDQLISRLFMKEPKLKFLENEQHLIEVMKRFDIIVKLWKSPTLYMPCMMESCSFKRVRKRFMKKSQSVNMTSWLCLEFEFLPPAFFNHILAWYIKQYHVSTIFDKETRTNRNALYRQIGVFDLDSSGCEQIVVCEGLNIIALQVWDTRKSGGTYGYLRKSLCQFIETIQKRYSLKISHTKSFKCKDGDFTMNRKKMADLYSADYRCLEHMENHLSEDLVKPWDFMDALL
ncbi:unnamed protein product [Mytilus coruscus]|uniref:Ig-like domain-containing protein n=1 Tax=Mytilus coruscus TaxID=42192 RepID=A0A6J8DUH2_MYTCO|nr:unnamed protein product [Mytilus coruscus]